MEPQLIKKYLKYATGLIVLILVVCAVGYFIYKNIIPVIFPQKNIPQTQKSVDLSPAQVTFVGGSIAGKTV